MIQILFIISLFLLIGWIFASRSSPCPSWLGWLIERENPLAKISHASTLIKNSEIEPGMTILDAGCGPGRVTIPLAEKATPGKVVAMDIQKRMLEQAQKKATKEELTNIVFLHGGLGENRLEPDQFDRALLVTMLGEIPDQEKALKEIHSSLKPDGILSITETIFDPHYQRLEAVLKRAAAIGFQEKNRFKSPFGYTLNVKKT